MTTVAHIVGKIIAGKPFIEDALSRGIINYAGLAEVLLPEIESELRKKIQQSAVIMALRRFAEKLPKKIAVPSAEFCDTDITIKSDLFEITVSNSPTLIKSVQKIYELADVSKGDFLTITQGLYEVTIIASRKFKHKIRQLLLKENVTKVIDALSSLTIRISEKAVEQVGLFYIITKALAWENIPITEIVSTFTEQTYVIKTEYIAKAFYAVKKIQK